MGRAPYAPECLRVPHDAQLLRMGIRRPPSRHPASPTKQDGRPGSRIVTIRGILPWLLLALRTPVENERGPLYMDQFLAALHQANPTGLPVSLEIARIEGATTLLVRFPAELRSVIEAQLYAHYPECHLAKVDERIEAGDSNERHWCAPLILERDIFPIRRYGQFEDGLRPAADPLTALVMAVAAQRHPRCRVSMRLTLQPAQAHVIDRATECVEALTSPLFRSHPHVADRFIDWARSPSRMRRIAARFLRLIAGHEDPEFLRTLSTPAGRLHDREADLQAAMDKLGRLLFHASITLSVRAPSDGEAQAAAMFRELAAAFGPLGSPRRSAFRLGRIREANHSRGGAGFLLSTEEAATIWHAPTTMVRAPGLLTIEARELAPPLHVPGPLTHKHVAVLGRTVFRGERQVFGILPDDRRRHVLAIGKTGQGKSTLLAHLIASDIRAGRGVGLLDPHGDLCEAILAGVPSERTNDVILLDAGDARHPVSFNPLDCPRAEDRALVASGVLSAFKKLYGESWGPRMEHILRNTLLALLERPGSTLLTAVRLLSDDRFRSDLTGTLADPIVRAFWQREFPALPRKLQVEATAPVLNKLGHFVSTPLLRNILGQPKSTLQLRRILDEGKILLVNLSKGRMGDDASALLGAFLTTAIQLAAMSRADVPEEKRPDFFLYVDEFQNFATESFASILSEARKYGLALTLANQYLAQLDEATAAAVFGNVGTLISFQVGAGDADVIATQLGGDLLPRDLLNVPRFQAYARLLIDGSPSRPFSMQTLPPRQARDKSRSDTIRRTSARRYTRPLAEVERQIAEAMG